MLSDDVHQKPWEWSLLAKDFRLNENFILKYYCLISNFLPYWNNFSFPVHLNSLTGTFNYFLRFPMISSPVSSLYRRQILNLTVSFLEIPIPMQNLYSLFPFLVILLCLPSTRGCALTHPIWRLTVSVVTLKLPILPAWTWFYMCVVLLRLFKTLGRARLHILPLQRLIYASLTNQISDVILITGMDATFIHGHLQIHQIWDLIG